MGNARYCVVLDANERTAAVQCWAAAGVSAASRRIAAGPWSFRTEAIAETAVASSGCSVRRVG